MRNKHSYKGDATQSVEVLESTPDETPDDESQDESEPCSGPGSTGSSLSSNSMLVNSSRFRSVQV